MGRVAKYTQQSILDTALELITSEGVAAATVSSIAQRLGAPSGSIYHRFPSRDLLLATLWLQTVKAFQKGFLAALEDRSPLSATRRAVLHTLEWSARHPNEAELLAMFRREDLIARWPDALGDELAHLNRDVELAIHGFAEAQFGEADESALGRSWFALVHVPHAAVRGSLRNPHASAWLRAAVVSASLAVLTSDGVAS